MRARAEGRVAERLSAADTRRFVTRKASNEAASEFGEPMRGAEAASERDMRDRKFAGVTG